MADYKISLGVQLQIDDIISQINEAERKVDPITIKVDAETKELTKSIQDALKTLSNGSKNALTLDTSKFEGSIADIKSAVVDLKKVLGTLDDSANMKSLLASVNQIANAIGKVTDESETLVKSLSILSKKDFGFNFNLKTGNANPIKAATDYGIEARRKAIPAMQEQVAFLQDIIGGTEKADKALERYLVKQNKGFGGVREKERLQREMLGGVDLDGKSVSISRQMGAYEQTISILKKIAIESGKSLDGFDAHFSKAAENIVDDTVKIQTGVKQTEEALESAANEMKQIFSMGVGAEQLSAQLDPIVQDLNKIREAVQNLSKGVSLDGLTASFDRLSGAIENLLANAEKVKGVLNSGFDGGKVGSASTSVDTSAINKIEKASDDATAAIVQNEKKKQEAYKATTDTVLYHAGVVSKLNKAETNGRFYGSNRGTGYFGTGHYFVDSATKHELDNNGYYNKLPYTSVDISQYDNLFKATTDEVADRLHTFLANLTSFTQGSDNYDVSELFAQFKSVFGDTIMDVKEFGSRLDQLKAFMSNSSLDDRSDSVSTQFMKSLGYEGVDTRGTRFADTRYGTVIYDLKEESILQANITDELQKQGQMLEKINYAKGQVFDKGEDERIQGILDQQAKKREIAEEFQNSFDTTNLKNVDADLTSAKNRLKEIDEIIYDVQYGMDNAEQEVRKFAKEMSDFGLDMSEDEIKEEIQRRTNNYGEAIDELSREKAELQSKIPVLEEAYNKEQQLANEAYKQAEQTVEQRRQEAQQAQEAANAVVQDEERKQQAYRETADTYEKISKDTSLTRDDAGFQKVFKVFEESNQAAQEAQRHFQELLADEKAVVSVTEQFDDNNALQSFTVNIKRATGEVETLRYAMDKLNDEGDEGFVYQGGSASDSRVEKQLEARIKKANDLQVKLDKIKSGYKDANASKPIKDDDHIKALDVQYRKVEKAIIAVRNADDSTFSSMIANAEKEKAVLESMIREYRNAENVATSLRSKDISTVKDTYASKLDVLVSKMKSSGVYTDGFEKGAENLRSVLSDATDASGLVKFLNGLDKLEAGYKRADAAAKEFNRSQKVGINTSGLESKIADLQRISPEIDKFETEIDGAKVSVKSLIDDLQQVKTQGDFSVVNARFKAFKEAASAAGIAVTEVAQKAKSINDIKIKISDTGFNGFEQEVLRARNAAEELEGVYPDLEAALKRLDVAMEDVYSADQAGDVKRLIAANEEYEASLKQVYSQLKLYQQAEQKAYKAEMLNQKKSALSSEMETWLKENTRAARDFGEEIRRLQTSLNGLDDKGVKLVGQQFKAITKQAQAMGKTGLTTFDRLKLKIKEYSSYLSAAELFMYAEQAMRSMFEQVKLIDSAMTELKKVTDETDASYNKFLSNAASRSKELGTTIDGLVSSTADFARLGYDFVDAQGLAEVANIYAVVGDEIEGVEGATESLISTMAAFKDSASGMSNSDFAMSIIDKFNEVSNNFAISSGGIGEAMQRSASSLRAANNTIDESIALITAANTVVVLCHAT